LSGAGLLLRSFSRLLQVDTGIAADKIVTMLVNVENRYRTPPEQGRYFEEMSARLAALPGIAAVGATSVLPFAVHPIDSVVRIAGRPEPAPGAEPLAHLTWATTGYFQAIGIPLLRGRLFNSFDTAETPPVVVISETLARRFFPNEDPLGQKFVSFVGRERRESEIIGIVGDVRHRGLDNAARPEFYRAQLQAPVEFMTFAVQAQGDPLGIVAAVKNEIWTANKDLAVTNVRTMEEVIGETLATRRFSSLLLAVFALLALLLAGVGIYGVMSYSTRRRTQEIGVRLVLGARPRDILRLVLREGLRLAAFGIGVGFIGALLLTRFMKTLLFGVAPTDPLTFGVVALLLSMVALLACWIPARRAAQVDPMVALRIE
jgi:putative ABC transport system permease protein